VLGDRYGQIWTAHIPPAQMKCAHAVWPLLQSMQMSGRAWSAPQAPACAAEVHSAAAATPSVTVPDRALSCTLLALTTTDVSSVTLAGALYVTKGPEVPESVPGPLSMSQLTESLKAPVPETAAVRVAP
jgi:hypothetical protein